MTSHPHARARGRPELGALIPAASRRGRRRRLGWVLSDLKTLLETGEPMDAHDGLNQG